jgi:hypothetical protein
MTPPALRRASGALGRALGRTARALGLARPATRAAVAVLRRLEPGHPVLQRAEAAALLYPCEHRVPTGYQHTPIPGGGCLETLAERPLAAVPDGYAQGRADLQLTHAVQADLRRRADALRQDSKDRWNALAARAAARHPQTAQADGHAGQGEQHACRCDSWRLRPVLRGRTHPCRCVDGPDEPSHLPAGASW